ncbi:uncharacterized protein LOC124807119 [Hydra vulgaris]|uniref:uncharacterized protein LOC124807119 n=1 Tax=Hydra vulgaris TaxID=6087 RepID=UPI0001925CEB|nr:uncharacterized protein LOC124807119 [Hydra vulgaris]
MFKVLCLAVLFVFVATRSTSSKSKSLRVSSKDLLRRGRDLGETAGTQHPSTRSRHHSGHQTREVRVITDHTHTTNEHTGTDRSTRQHITNTKRHFSGSHHSRHHTTEKPGTSDPYKTTEKHRATTKQHFEKTKRYASME